jgi:hypothetical protein
VDQLILQMQVFVQADLRCELGIINEGIINEADLHAGTSPLGSGSGDCISAPSFVRYPDTSKVNVLHMVLRKRRSARPQFLTTRGETAAEYTQYVRDQSTSKEFV